MVSAGTEATSSSEALGDVPISWQAGRVLPASSTTAQTKRSEIATAPGADSPGRSRSSTTRSQPWLQLSSQTGPPTLPPQDRRTSFTFSPGATKAAAPSPTATYSAGRSST